MLYPTNEIVLHRGEAMTPLLPLGPVASSGYVTVFPELPNGIHLDDASGMLSGTPTAPWPETTYRFRATSSHGESETTLTISVLDPAPTNFRYAVNPAVYTLGVPAPVNAPQMRSGSATSFTVSPALPAGLSLNPSTGTIRGVPVALSPMQSYVVVARGSGGETPTDLSIAVQDAPPRSLSYAIAAAAVSVGMPLVPNCPTVTGGVATRFTVDPSLPPGISLDAESGIVSGTPMVGSPLRTYRVTAENAAGSATAQWSLTVRPLPSGDMNYESPATALVDGLPAPKNRPVRSPEAGSVFSVTPPLPAGLVLDPRTGEIRGTPKGESEEREYRVTAKHGSTTKSGTVALAVRARPLGSIAYGNPLVVAARGERIAVPPPKIVGGGRATVFSTLPSLPAGLAIDASTGAIGGTVTVPAARRTYQVFASNSTNRVATSLTLEVRDIAPASLVYGTSPAQYKVGMPIVRNTPSNAGGVPTRYTLSVALPAGLLFDEDSGVISGTPTTPALPRRYEVVATNAGGSTTGAVTISVVGENRPPKALSQVVYTVRDTVVPVRLAGSDPDGDPLRFTVQRPPQHGRLDGTAPTLVYVPAAGWTGSDEFTFVVADAELASAPATIQLTVAKAGARAPASMPR